MSTSDFIIACLAATVAPELALENDTIRAALAARDDESVLQALTEEF